MTPDGQLPADRYFPGSGSDDPGLPGDDELFSTRPAATPAGIRNALRAKMGEDVPRAPRPPDYPDVHGLAQDLGLA